MVKARISHWVGQMTEILITWERQKKIAKKDKAQSKKKNFSKRRILTQILKIFLTLNLIKNVSVPSPLSTVLPKDRKKLCLKDQKLLINLFEWRIFRINLINQDQLLVILVIDLSS